MAQKFTSARTSVNVRNLPKVFGKLPEDLPRHSLVYDLGAGKFTNHIESFIRSRGLVYLPYDPYNKPDDVNATSTTYLLNAMHCRYPVTVTCSNVLNVIDDDAEIKKIAAGIVHIVLRTGGKAYITVYVGDRSGIGRQTGPDQYQRNQPLAYYLPLFKGTAILNHYGKKYTTTAAIERGMIVVRCLEVSK